MKYLKHIRTFNDIFAKDNFGIESEENILNYAKSNLLQKLYNQEIKDNILKSYVIMFANQYWDDTRIEEEIDKYGRIVNGLYKNPISQGNEFISREELYYLIKEKNPFDIILIVRNEDEFIYDYEEKQRYGINRLEKMLFKELGVDK